MALRLGDHVVCGEIFNTRRNGVHGYIGLRGLQRPVLLQLVGNCAPDLAGRHIRFEVREACDAERDAADESDCESEQRENEILEQMNLKSLAWQQIGPAGEMTAAKRVRVADCPPGELYARCKLGEPPPMKWKRCLYLEWFSQNGHVVLELVDPIIEYVEDDEEKEPADASAGTDTDAASPGQEPQDFADADLGDDDDAGTRCEIPFYDDPDEPAETDDPYNLIPDELQRALDAQARETDLQAGVDAGESGTTREIEMMDELIQSGAGEPLDMIFDEPVRMPRPDQLSDEQAEAALKVLLARLALHGVAFDLCEHFTMAQAYRLLVERLFPEELAFPQLRGTQWVQHFSTSDFCAACQGEYNC